MRHQESDNYIDTDPKYKLAIKQIIGKCEENIDACEERPSHHLKKPILG
jgi:hypothetical protein